MYSKLIFLIGIVLFSCKNHTESTTNPSKSTLKNDQYIIILGIAQDGGFPHINNHQEFEDVSSGTIRKELVVSLGIVDKEEDKKFIIEATPDMPEQLSVLHANHLQSNTIINGVFLTHAHLGHYTGLMYFGREAMGSSNIPVYVMPKMKSFLEHNGPWSQLVALHNIALYEMKTNLPISVTDNITVTPFLVPHRDEYSETVGYTIEGKNKKALFIPDINKWSLWDKSIVEEVKKVDYAFVDATFFEDGEILRPMAEVPHPFIQETLSLFQKESKQVKSKVVFIHFNHSNPMLDKKNKKRIELEEQGYGFAVNGDIFPL